MGRLLAAVVLLTSVLGPGWVAAQGQNSLADGFQNYFAATARNAALGARTEAVRRTRVAAALSPLVTEVLVRQPGRISPMIRGLRAAAPDVAPGLVRNAMTAFPGFAGQIAQAAGQTAGQAPFESISGPSIAPDHPARQRLIHARAARVAAWAVSAIARDSGALEQIMAQAMAAAPGNKAPVVQAVAAAYPGFALRIATATGIRPPAAPARMVRRPVHAVQVIVRTPVIMQPSAPRVMAPPAAVQAVVQPIVQRNKQPGRAAAPAQALPEGLRLADSDEDDGEIDDPLEPMNRIIFAFNETIDLILLRPIAIGYNFLMPELVTHAVRRFFLNLDAPVILANDLLQGDFADAGVTLGRFGVNSTLGVLGLFDPAAGFGWERHHADFGQTLHSYDIGAGPYLVLPLLGPASSRGGVGKVVDIVFQPMTYLLSTGQSLAVGTTRAMVRREELLTPLDQLRENSVDYYTGLKAAYWQARQIELNKGTMEGLGDGGADKLFDAIN
jgi:phospholipid-binding lipoprotein MlaA